MQTSTFPVKHKPKHSLSDTLNFFRIDWTFASTLLLVSLVQLSLGKGGNFGG